MLMNGCIFGDLVQSPVDAVLEAEEIREYLSVGGSQAELELPEWEQVPFPIGGRRPVGIFNLPFASGGYSAEAMAVEAEVKDGIRIKEKLVAAGWTFHGDKPQTDAGFPGFCWQIN
jgi:hypothetical protein